MDKKMDDFEAFLEDEDDFFVWRIEIFDLAGTSYEHGRFTLTLDFRTKYPI